MTETFVVIGPSGGVEMKGYTITEECLRGVAQEAGNIPVTTESPPTPGSEVGTVTNARYDEDNGLVMEVEIEDEEVAEMIDNSIADLAPAIEIDEGSSEITAAKPAWVMTCPEADSAISTQCETHRNLSDYVGE